jgi:hypothetical protein
VHHGQVGEWIKYQPGSQNRSFYYNQNSGDFQWERPTEFMDDTATLPTTVTLHKLGIEALSPRRYNPSL